MGDVWPVYPIDSVTLSSSRNRNFAECERLSAPSAQPARWSAEQVKENTPMRHYVAAVVLGHENGVPCLMLFSSRGENSNDELSYVLDFLPTCEMRMWEPPEVLLLQQLDQLIESCESTRSTPGLEFWEKQQTITDMKPTPVVVESSSTVTDDGPPPTSSPQGSPVTPVQSPIEDDMMADDSEVYAGISEGQTSSVIVDEGGSSEMTSTSIQQQQQQPSASPPPEVGRLRPIVGEYLGSWWTAEHGGPPLPTLGPHISRPRSCTKLYQVHIPPKSTLHFPKKFAGRSLRWIPLSRLLESGFPLPGASPLSALGIGFMSLPQVISSFRLQFQVPRGRGGSSFIKDCGRGTLQQRLAAKVSRIQQQEKE